MDTQLVIRAQRWDEAALAVIIASSYVRLQDVANGILRDPYLAEDAAPLRFRFGGCSPEQLRL